MTAKKEINMTRIEQRKVSLYRRYKVQNTDYKDAQWHEKDLFEKVIVDPNENELVFQGVRATYSSVAKGYSHDSEVGETISLKR